MEGTSLWLLSLKKAAEMLSITQFVQFDACACFDDSPIFLVPIFRQRYFLETTFQACSFALINSFADGETYKISSWTVVQANGRSRNADRWRAVCRGSNQLLVIIVSAEKGY